LTTSEPIAGGGIWSDGQVTISNGKFDCSSINSAPCFNASSLTFAGGSTAVIASYEVVGASSTSRISGSPELYFEYLSNSTEEGLTALPLIHLESIWLSFPTLYKLTIVGVGGEADRNFSRWLVFNGERSRGCAFSVPSLGDYIIQFEAASPPVSGLLGHDGIALFAANEMNDNFYSVAHVHRPTSSPTPGPTAVFTDTIFRHHTRIGQIFLSLNCLLMGFDL
jgi:hypothetical protein